MNIYKTALFVSAACMAALLGCKDNSTGTNSGSITLDNTDTSTVLQIGNGTLTSQSTTYACEGDQLTSSTETTVVNYEIVNGQLQIWEDGDCSKIIFTGTSTTIQGTWNTDFSTTTTADPNCADEENIQELLPYLNNASGTAVITDSTLLLSFQGELCMAQLITNEMLADTANVVDGDDFGLSQVQAQGCSRVSFLLGEGVADIPGSITFAENNEGDVVATLTMGDCSSTAVMPQFGGMPTCPEENPFDDPQMQTCLMQYIVENGCFADMMLQGLGDTEGITKIDCNTIQMIDPESGQTTTIQMTPATGGVNVTLTVGNCSTSFFQSYDDIGDEPTIEDPEFTACIMDQQQPMTLLKQAIPKIKWPSLD